VIVIPALWPETYSYTLTLAMMTELPIIALKPDFDYAITDRLRAYNQSYLHNFSDMSSVVSLARSVQAKRSPLTRSLATRGTAHAPECASHHSL
jgi:hypothetical protein